jgi:flagellar protein FlaF
MYRFSYAEVLDEAPNEARHRERKAIEHSIELLAAAEAKGARSREAIEALLFTRRLWTLFLEDLARPENQLPPALKGDLISIGIWVLNEADKIRLERSKNFKGVIEVSRAIAEGLQ